MFGALVAFILVFAGAILFLGLIYRSISEGRVVKTYAMESFAKKNGFTFSQTIKIADKKSSASLLNKGSTRNIFRYMKGDYKGRKVEIYNYSHSWRNYSHEYIVVEFKTKSKLPGLIITTPDSYLVDNSLYLPLSITTSKESLHFVCIFRIYNRNHCGNYIRVHNN